MEVPKIIEEMKFAGVGKVDDGTEVTVEFDVHEMKIDREPDKAPIITIIPRYNYEKDTFIEMTVNTEREEGEGNLWIILNSEGKW